MKLKKKINFFHVKEIILYIRYRNKQLNLNEYEYY